VAGYDAGADHRTAQDAAPFNRLLWLTCNHDAEKSAHRQPRRDRDPDRQMRCRAGMCSHAIFSEDDEGS
jgi:hypothetical protein